MAATFPGGVKSFSTKQDGIDKIYAAHVNDMQSEITALETNLVNTNGLAKLTSPAADRLLFWDQSGGGLKWLSLDPTVIITDTVIKARDQVVMLASPLMPSAWNPKVMSTTAKTLINLNTEFGTPAGIKAIIVEGSVKDTGGSTTETRLVLGPNNTSLVGTHLMGPISNTRYAAYNNIVQCNADGNIYYQAVASGTNTMTVYLQIQGYIL